MRASVDERFWAKVQKSDGCWLWTGARTKFGYGWFNADWNTRGPELAHRVAYRLTHGKVDGYVCHHCDNPQCVRPDHLYEGTPKTNVRDMLDRGRHKWASKTHCAKGHEFTPENTYVYRSPVQTMRQCRICLKAAKTASQRKHAAKRNSIRREKRATARLHGEPK